jgi:molecular chaperone DnaK
MPSAMAVVGIDLGTTNTVVACVRNGRVNVLPDEQGRRLLPSVVSFHPNGEVLVGYPAKERRVVDARNTIASVKRLIGRAWDSEEIHRAKQRFAFELKEGPGQGPLVIARGQDYTLPEISAFVLRRARQIAEASLGEPVDKAVITVPATFNELQRAATKVAGRVAGLDVLRIINEPTAAALAYGLGRTAKERIAIYDFGGGTFDCTLLDLSGNVFEVLATSGDTFLGGDDLDIAIAERMAEAFLHAHRYDPRTDPQAFERLRAEAEVIKIELSSKERGHARLREVAFGVGGAHLDLDFGMTRDELEMLATPLVERTFAVCQEALSLARLPVSAFDRVILVGGSTRIPLVRRRVELFFGAPPLDRVNPEEVVAIGAAIQAAALTEVARRRSIPPPPAQRRSYSSEITATDVDSPDEVTIATNVSSLVAEQEKARLSVPAAGEVPRTVTARLAPPPPAQTRTARMSSPDTGVTKPMAQPPLPPAAAPDPAATIPRPLVFEEVLRAERASIPDHHPSPFPPLPIVTQPIATQPVPVVPAQAFVQPPPVPAPPQPVAFAPPPPVAQPPALSSTLPIVPPRAQTAPPYAPTVRAPVLVDVTPRALVVETVAGWCDVIVQRNAKIPCERTRAFTTSSDMQTLVRVRVAQGEDASFAQNTYLGEVELSGLRPAPRGDVTIQVRFEVDESGTLKVFATDLGTGREARATLQLVGIADHNAIQAMQARQSAMRLQ